MELAETIFLGDTVIIIVAESYDITGQKSRYWLLCLTFNKLSKVIIFTNKYCHSKRKCLLVEILE